LEVGEFWLTSNFSEVNLQFDEALQLGKGEFSEIAYLFTYAPPENQPRHKNIDLGINLLRCFPFSNPQNRHYLSTPTKSPLHKDSDYRHSLRNFWTSRSPQKHPTISMSRLKSLLSNLQPLDTPGINLVSSPSPSFRNFLSSYET